MSGNRQQGTPVDRSAEEEAVKAKAEAEEKARQEAAKQAWAEKLGGAYSGAINDARDYFTMQGLDPDDFMSAINQQADRIRGNIPTDAADPLSFFNNLGQNVYDTQETTARNKYLRQFNEFAPTGFENRRIADTTDDDILAAINAEQYGSADQYLQNLLSRGVITSAGYEAGRRDLDNQQYRAKAQLEEAGLGALSSARTQIGNLANEGRNAAANYQLGNQFDPFSYSTDINNSIDAFLQGLGGNIRNRLPGQLYTTSGLAAKAGAGQGAQNTKFDPNALAGLFVDNNDDDDDNTSANFSSIF